MAWLDDEYPDIGASNPLSQAIKGLQDATNELESIARKRAKQILKRELDDQREIAKLEYRLRIEKRDRLEAARRVELALEDLERVYYAKR